MSNFLTEAFKQLECLNEETFDIQGDELDALDKFLQGDDPDAQPIAVIDPDAEDEEHIEDSYEGKIILECCTCHSLSYKDPEDVIPSDDSEIVNVEEECPFCFSAGGFTVIGKVAAFDPNAEDDEEDEDELQLKNTDDELEPKDDAEELDDSDNEADDESGDEVDHEADDEADEDDVVEDDVVEESICQRYRRQRQLTECEKRKHLIIDEKMSEEDEADTAMLREIERKFQKRSNAALTADEKAILSKYHLQPMGKDGLRLDASHGFYPVDRNDALRNANINLADKARKTADRIDTKHERNAWFGMGSIPDTDKSRYFDYDSPERFVSNKGLTYKDYEPVRRMKNALKNRKYNQNNLDDVDGKYENRIADIQQKYDKQLKDAERDYNWAKDYHQKGLDHANDTIDTLLKRKSQHEALMQKRRATEKLNEHLRHVARQKRLAEAKSELSTKSKTFSYALTQNQDELAGLIKKPISEIVDFVDNISGTVSNKSFIEKVKSKLQTMKKSSDAVEYLYNIILKGDDMGSMDFAKKQKAYEDFNDVEITTDDAIMKMSSDDDGEVVVTTKPVSDEVIVPVEEEPENAIQTNAEIEQNTFDELINKYFEEVYDNVTSYQTNDIDHSEDSSAFTVDGTITFDSGNEKETQFNFNLVSEEGKAVLKGSNVQIDTDPEAFTIKGESDDEQFTPSQLDYCIECEDDEPITGTVTVAEEEASVDDNVPDEQDDVVPDDFTDDEVADMSVETLESDKEAEEDDFIYEEGIFKK